MRHKPYDAMPQKPSYEDRKTVVYGEHIQLYAICDLVEKSIGGNVNANEWLGYSIEKKAPRIIPEGYRHDFRHDVLIPPGYAYCTGCCQVHPLSFFGTDPRNTGRGKTRSQCRSWRTDDKRRLGHEKVLSRWKRG